MVSANNDPFISPGCIACTGPCNSKTFFNTLKCHKNCYYCFNPNQRDYEKWSRERYPWKQELRNDYESGIVYDCLSLTGGEPLLFFDDVVDFVSYTKQLYPSSHVRLYTSGELPNEKRATLLSKAGLDEIRFSIKFEDSVETQNLVLLNIEQANSIIKDVMVEMPVIPGSTTWMKELIASLDTIGIAGINLLEFCFPYNSWNEFKRRGFTIKNPPYGILYDYNYAGGLPVADSEEGALELMLFALKNGFNMGLHYCSLENKHRSEMRQRNATDASTSPCHELDQKDFLIKTIKVFGDEREITCKVLTSAECIHMIENSSEQSISFHPKFLRHLDNVPVNPLVSMNVLGQKDGVGYLRELALEVAKSR